MNADMIVRTVFSVLFLGTLIVGFYMFKNSKKLFGEDARVPTDNSGSRRLNKVQIIVIWAHAVAITAAFALFG